MSRRKRTPPVAKPSIAVVADGQTEAWYLNMLKRNERHIRITIKPEIYNKKSLKDQFEFVSDLAGKEYNEIFWIVDLDTIIKETREARKGEETSMALFVNYRDTLQKTHKNVNIVVNNPCLEYWFLLHFEKTNKVFDSCAKAELQLKTYLKDYEKTKRYYTRQNNDIYLKLRPYLNEALDNSTALGSFDENNPNKAMCEMKIFFFCKELEKYFK